MIPGLELFISEELFHQKLNRIRAIIFDWDGVFNDGTKGPHLPSTFSERDSMGTNMLRFALWQRTGSLPYTAIITGSHSHAAETLTRREHYHAMIYGALYKADVFFHLIEGWGLASEDTLFIYDDILDLSVASKAGMRIQISYPSSPRFDAYCKEQNLCDACVHGINPPGAVRYICDELTHRTQFLSASINHRMAFDSIYQSYFDERQLVEPVILPAGDLLQSQDTKYIKP